MTVEPRHGGRRRGGRRWPLYAGALALAWILPMATHLVGADAVLPLVVWVGTAAALRGGRTVVDRLMLAAGLLTGLTTAAGMLFSVWPWGLHPVPVAGCALTALVLAAVAGRTPALPRRFDLSDAVLVAATVGVGVLIARPLLGGSEAKMAVLGRGEDGARHFALFDHIRRFDGYVYFHRGETGDGLQAGFESYPQGGHLIMALIDNFVRSTKDLGAPLTRFDDFALIYAATFAFSVACLLWAARHVLGDGHRGLAYLPYAALVAGYFFLGEGIPIFIHGFVSEIAAIGPYALLVALLVRPLRDLREQIVVVAALVGAVSMIYYLFLIAIAPVVLIWALSRHRDLRRLWRWSVPAVVLGGALACAAPLLNIAQANSADQLTRDGGVEHVNRNLLVVLVLAVAAGLITTRTGRRSPAWRMMTVWFAVTLLYAIGLYGYSVVATGQSRYYFEKALHQVIVVGLVGIGAIGLLVPRHLSRARARYRPLVAGALAAAAMVMFAGPYTRSFGGPPPGMTWGQAHAQRRLAFPVPAATTIAAFRAVPVNDTGMVNVVYVEGHLQEFTSYTSTLWVSVLRGDNGRAWQEPLRVLQVKSEQDVVEWIRSNPEPIRFITDSAMIESAVASVRRDDPGVRVEIVRIEHP